MSIRKVKPLTDHDNDVKHNEAWYRKLVQLSPEGMLIIRGNKIEFINAAGIMLLGASDQSQIFGKQLSDLFDPGNRLLIEARLAELGKEYQTVSVSEVKMVRLDGTAFDAEVLASSLVDETGFAVQIIFRDIFKRKQAEYELAKLNRVLRVLSDCNQVLVRSSDESSLLQDVCDTIVEKGGFPFAWVGYAGYDNAWSIYPVAQAGNGSNYLASVDLTWADSGHGRSPSGRAMRTGKTVVANRISIYPVIKQWRAVTMEHGYAALISLPLIAEGVTFGILNVYSDEPDAFQVEEVKLLGELAGDVAYGIASIRTRLAQRQAEEALCESLERFHRTLDNMLEGCQIIDPNWRYVYVNDAVARHGRTSKDELIGHTMMEVYPGIENTTMFAVLRQCMEQRITKKMENEFVYPDGSIGWFELSLQPVPEGVFILSIDMTERKRLEIRAQHQLDNLAALRTIDIAIASNFDLKITLAIALEQALNRLGVDASDVLLLDPQSTTLEYVAGRGFRTEGLTKTYLQLGMGHASQCVLERKIVSIPNLPRIADRFVRANLIAGEDFVAYFGAPLLAKGEVKGVLEVFRRSALRPDEEWLNFFETLAGQIAIAVDNARLFSDLQRSNFELTLAYDETIEGWSRALDLRDKETEGHTRRVAELTVMLARRAGMDATDIMHIRRGALLHDIGEMVVPDHILFKPGKLTDEEWDIVKMHPDLANEMLSPIEYLHSALEIPYCHHEKWDGSGYPRGLSGKEIPLAARLFAVVDVWDSLRSDRPYRDGWPENKARRYIRETAGTHFDPRAVEQFLELIKDGDAQYRS